MAQRKRGKKIFKEEKFVTKHISIKEKQEKWLDENCVNFSKFVQMKLEEVMTK